VQICVECWIDELLLCNNNADSIVLHIFSKFGGSRWMASLSSAFLLVPIACFSIFTWADPIGAWVVGFVELSMCTGGMSHPHGFSFQPLMSSRHHRNITSRSKEAGSFTMLVIFTVSNSDELIKLKLSMMQIDCTHTKGGLCVDSVFIYPKGYSHEKTNIIRM
jgi:hypothetical protein